MRALALASLFILGGCVSAPNVPQMQYYVLGNGAETAAVRAASQRNVVLLVNPTSASSFYDTQRLVFSRAEGERAYYQFAAWTERPARAFAQLLGQRLDAPSTTSGVRGDLILHTRLEELYHDASAAPGAVKITMSAELVDREGRLLGERQRFSRSAPAASENAAGAVDAANRALAQMLDDIAAWVEQTRRGLPPPGQALSRRSP